MKNNNSKILVESRRNILNSLINYIKQGLYVFILGPNGSGKTTLLQASVMNLKNLPDYSCRLFDLKKADEKGAYYFYNTVIKKVSRGKYTIEEGHDLSKQFIECLEKCLSRSSETVVIMFDNFRAVNSDFYDHFAKDCRMIFNEGKANPGSGLSKIIMIFAGSLVGLEGHETSPLWNITEKIRMELFSERELKENIELYSAEIGLPIPSENRSQFIYNCTEGHLFLARSMVRFFKKQGRHLENLDEKDILETFIEYIWRVTNTSEPEIKDNEKNLRKHFINIVEYLEISPQILKIVLDLLNNEPSPQLNYQKVDHITITGCIAKDDSGYYQFSNVIYEEYLKKLLFLHRKADFCVFHYRDSELWNKAKEIYRELKEEGKLRELDQPLSPRTRHFSSLVEALINRLKSYSNLADFVSEFQEMLSLVFEISIWDIYRIEGMGKETSVQRDDPNFKGAITDELKKAIPLIWDQSTFVGKALLTQIPTFDWTGRWIAIPVKIREDFSRLFIVQIQESQKKLSLSLGNFIQRALMIYYYISSQEKYQNELKQLREASSLRKLSPVQTESQKLWEICKPIVRSFGIDDFYLHEILGDEFVLTTHSGQEKLSSIESKTKLEDDPVLLKAASALRNGNIHYILNNDRTHFVGKPMQTGNLMIARFSMSVPDYERIESSLLDLLNLMVFTIDQGRTLRHREEIFQILNRTLLNSDDHMFVVDREKRVLFMNNKLKELVKIDDPCCFCYKAIAEYEFACPDCPLDSVFMNGEIIRKTFEREIADQILDLDITFLPIHDESNDQIIAAAIYMHDVSDAQILWKSLQIMARVQSVEQIENLIMETLEILGLKRVFRYRPDPKNKGRFIGEDLRGPLSSPEKFEEFRDGKRSFFSDAPELYYDHVIVWYRQGTPKANLRNQISDRLDNSGFTFRASDSWPAYDPVKDAQKKNKPDFFITVPIMSKDGISKLYSMDNWGDDELDKKLITLNKLQILETFATAASQIRENLVKMKSLEHAQHFMSHGSKEQIQIIRMLLARIIFQQGKQHIENLVQTADASLELLQSGFESLLATERTVKAVQKNECNIAKILKERLEIYQAVGREGDIQFELILPKKKVICKTDETFLIHILNNLISNSIRHLSQIELPDKKIVIKTEKMGGDVTILISDNGEGLPEEYNKYFNTPFKPGLLHSAKSLGLAQSREMAYMMDGSLELVTPGYFDKGTAFRLTLK